MELLAQSRDYSEWAKNMGITKNGLVFYGVFKFLGETHVIKDGLSPIWVFLLGESEA